MQLAVLGSTGRTGRLLLDKALAAGHRVRVLVRDAKKITVTSPKLVVIEGDVRDEARLREVMTGVDVVLSALGPTSNDPTVCSAATERVLPLMVELKVRRYVVVSGAALDCPGDDKGLIDRIFSAVVRTVTPAIFADKVREHALLTKSPSEWVLIRPPRLTDTQGTGHLKLSTQRPLSTKLPRSDLADFLLAQATDFQFVRKAPFVSA